MSSSTSASWTTSANGNVFRTDPLIPPEWQSDMAVQCRASGRANTRATSAACLFLTNVHQLYGGRDREAARAQSEIAAVCRRPCTGDIGARAQELRDRILSQRGALLVMNDEGHHLHNDDLKWAKTIDRDARRSRRSRAGWLAAQLDFTATPKHQDGQLFREIIVRLSDRSGGRGRHREDADHRRVGGAIEITSDDACRPLPRPDQRRRPEWRQFRRRAAEPAKKPIMFVMAENTRRRTRSPTT